MTALAVLQAITPDCIGGLATPVRRFEAFPFVADFAGVLLVALVVAIIAFLVRRGMTNARDDAFLFVFLPTSTLGAIGLAIGILLGNSVTSITGSALSGFLSLVGAFVVYVVTKDAIQASSRVAGACALLAMSFAIIYGASVASSYRVRFERHDLELQRFAEQQKKQFEVQLTVWEYSEKKRIDLLAASMKGDTTQAGDP